jgi:hypothetical protein
VCNSVSGYYAVYRHLNNMVSQAYKHKNVGNIYWALGRESKNIVL